MDTKHFPFRLVLRYTKAEREFPNAVELLAWLDEELEFYGPLSQIKFKRPTETLNGFIGVVTGIQTAKNNISSAISVFESDPARSERELASARKQLSIAYEQKLLPPVATVEVQRLRAVASDDLPATLVAVFAFADIDFGGNSIPLSEPAIIRGVGLAALVRYGYREDATEVALKELLEVSIAEQRRRADSIQKELDGALSAEKEMAERTRAAFDSFEPKYTELSENLTERVSGDIEKAAKSIADFKAAYQAEIALKQPVEFWEKKGKAHAVRANWYGGASLVTAIVAGGLAVRFLPTVIGDKGNYTGVGVAILLITLGLWLLRVLVRNYLGQSHLASDAEERVVMVKTYLSLTESGRAPSDTLAPVLAALFRTASDGLVKDDSMPAGVAELLTKAR